MGRPMALNLERAGHRLFVHARRKSAMEPLIAAGACACTSPAEVARQADISFVMVADIPDVEQVILGRVRGRGHEHHLPRRHPDHGRAPA